MTSTQKTIIRALLDGRHIGVAGNRLRLRDAAGNPLMTITAVTFDGLKGMDLLRRHKGLWLLNRSKVRQLHGNSWIKRLYNEQTRGPNSRNTLPRA